MTMFAALIEAESGDLVGVGPYPSRERANTVGDAIENNGHGTMKGSIPIVTQTEYVKEWSK